MFWARGDLQERKISFLLLVCVCSHLHLTLCGDGTVWQSHLDGITDSVDISLSKLWEMVKARNCSPLASSVLGFLQNTTGVGCCSLSLWIFLTRDQTCISCIVRQILYHWATWEALCLPCTYWAPRNLCTAFGDVRYKDEDNYFLRIICWMLSMPGYCRSRSWDFSQH